MFKNILSVIIVFVFVILAFGSEDSNSSSTETGSGSVAPTSAVSKSEWSGSSNIAGVNFNTNLILFLDEKRFSLSGSAGGSYFDDSGTYTESGSKIIMNSGEYRNWYFIKDGSSMDMYTDEGDYFMSLY